MVLSWVKLPLSYLLPITPMNAPIRSYCRFGLIWTVISAGFVGCTTTTQPENKPAELEPKFTGLVIEQGPTSLGAEPRKLQTLHRFGELGEAELVDAFGCLRRCPWSTLAAEQGHGSVADLRRDHREWRSVVLTTRSYLHQCAAWLSDL